MDAPYARPPLIVTKYILRHSSEDAISFNLSMFDCCVQISKHCRLLQDANFTKKKFYAKQFRFQRSQFSCSKCLPKCDCFGAHARKILS